MSSYVFQCKRKRRSDTDSESTYGVEAAAESLVDESRPNPRTSMKADFLAPSGNWVSKRHTHNGVIVVVTPTSIYTGSEFPRPIRMLSDSPRQNIFRTWQQQDLESSMPPVYVPPSYSTLQSYEMLQCPVPYSGQACLELSPSVLTVVYHLTSSATVASGKRAHPGRRDFYLLMREAWGFFAHLSDYAARQGIGITVMNVLINEIEIVVLYRISNLATHAVSSAVNKQSIAKLSRLCLMDTRYESTYCIEAAEDLLQYETRVMQTATYTGSNIQRPITVLVQSPVQNMANVFMAWQATLVMPSRFVFHLAQQLRQPYAMMNASPQCIVRREVDYANASVPPKLAICTHASDDRTFPSPGSSEPAFQTRISQISDAQTTSDELWEKVLRDCADDEDDLDLNILGQRKPVTSLVGSDEEEWVEIELNSPREIDNITEQSPLSRSFNLKEKASKLLQPFGDVLSFWRRKTDGEL